MNEGLNNLSFKQKQILEREKEILKVARRMFAEKGYFGTNLNEVAKEIGIARGTIYLHFKTKEDLLAAIIQKADAQILQALQQGITSTDDPFQKLSKIFREFLLACHEYEDLIKVMSNELRRAAYNRLHVSEGESSVTQLVAQTIEEGKQLGYFDKKIDTILAANALFSIVTIDTFRHAREERKIELEDIIHSALHIYFNGIQERGAQNDKV